MKIYHIVNGPLRVNTYFLVGENDQAVVIDCGESYNKIKQTEESLKVKIKAVLLTHAHFDHAGCAKKLQDDGAEIFVSVKDAPKLMNEQNLSSDFGRAFEYLTADHTFSDGDKITLAGITFEVIATPGHTDGSVTFKVDNALFTGDTLFYLSVGRTDFITGNRRELVASVKKLFALGGDYSVYPGHEDFTTLQYERDYNRMVDYD
jgi:glyoxylase-like metal-dependent hydrolase (beta-lactamase superfamily II)